MGTGASTPEEKEQRIRNSLIESELKRDERLAKKVIKMLLLGPSDSGKSTVLKQMRIIHDRGFSTEEQRHQKVIIYSNILESIASVIAAMKNLEISFAKPENEDNAEDVLRLATCCSDGAAVLSKEIVCSIKELWSDDGVCKCVSRANEYHLSDSTRYFMDSIDRIADESYSPTDQDILRARIRTTGVIEMGFDLKRCKFRFFDVGGQRSERKKWIHCFDNVQAIMYITSLSEYDQKLTEDNKTNRIHESLVLFDSICNNPCFVDASVLLFLNKRDIFETKVQRIPLTVAFPEYTGSQAYDECVQFVEREFKRRNQTKKGIYSHETCATDTGQIQFVLDSAIDMVIERNKKEAGVV